MDTSLAGLGRIVLRSTVDRFGWSVVYKMVTAVSFDWSLSEDDLGLLNCRRTCLLLWTPLMVFDLAQIPEIQTASAVSFCWTTYSVH